MPPAWCSLLHSPVALPPASAADKVKLSLAATNDPAYLPFFVAIDKGYYKALGLDVQPMYVGGGIATPGLISGAIEFSTSTGSAISAIIKGGKLKVVMTLSESPPWKLWVTDPSIKTLADLKGKAIGIQSHGDLFEMSMRNLLMQHGMSGDAVTYVQLGFGSAPRLAVIRKRSLPAVLLTNLEERIGRKDHLLGNAHMLVDISSVIRSPNNGLAVSDALLAKQPGVGRAHAARHVDGGALHQERSQTARCASSPSTPRACRWTCCAVPWKTRRPSSSMTAKRRWTRGRVSSQCAPRSSA